MANPDIIFYIIRRPEPGAGLLSNFHWVLGHIMYALQRNYIIVVDMENYKTYYNEASLINGTSNAWEYYFQQPMGYTLADAYTSKNVILSKMEYLYKILPDEFYNSKIISTHYTIISKYMQFNSDTIKAISKAQKALFKNKTNILGVLSRGTDYKYAYRHNIVPSCEDLIKTVKECYHKWRMEWIFLITEEQEVVTKFKTEFGDKLLITNHKRLPFYSKDMGAVPNISHGRSNDKYRSGLEYLIDVILLSKCDTLVASKTNGAMAAIKFNNNKYINKFIFELGVLDK
jgi:hypothetical protein